MRQGFDEQDVVLGSRINIVKELKIAGQSRRERKEMAFKLRSHELFERGVYASVKMFIKSLKHLPQRDDLPFNMDSRVFGFLVRAWTLDRVSDGYDLLPATRFYNDITEKLASISYMCAPHRASKYGRDLLQ